MIATIFKPHQIAVPNAGTLPTTNQYQNETRRRLYLAIFAGPCKNLPRFATRNVVIYR